MVPVGSRLAVLSYARRGGEGDLVTLTMPRATDPTSVRIDGGCGRVECARVVILLGVKPQEPHKGQQGFCELASGVLSITSVAEGRVEGSFSGRGRCARNGRTGPFSGIRVDQGRFGVEISESLRTGLVKIWA